MTTEAGISLIYAVSKLNTVLFRGGGGEQPGGGGEYDTL